MLSQLFQAWTPKLRVKQRALSLMSWQDDVFFMNIMPYVQALFIFNVSMLSGNPCLSNASMP
eukprot:2201836-Amphidinium_carterae.1